MAFCPSCRSEYRPGFTTCPPCAVDLVDSLDPSPREAASPDAPLAGKRTAPPDGLVLGETILEGPADPDAELEILTGRLSDAEIRFLVEEDLESRKARRSGVGGSKLLPWYRIHVEAARLAEARTIFEEEAEERRRSAVEAGRGEEAAEAAGADPEPDSKESAAGIVFKMAWLLVIVAIVAGLAWLFRDSLPGN